MIGVTINNLQVSPLSSQQLVILKEGAAERYLPIGIGPAEASAITVKLQGTAVSRPLTHDLLHSVIAALGAMVDCIVITDLENDTFYAKIVIEVNGGKVEVDSRPSDGLALAVRVGAPIFVEEAVLDEAGILLDEDRDKPVPSNRETEEMEGKSKKVSHDELRRMSAFTDFINTLDLDNMDKGQSMPKAYCMKCRQKREIKDPRQIALKNGRPAVQGTCPVCGGKLLRFGKF